jgi:type II secretory pathway pseudopilin PulG
MRPGSRAAALLQMMAFTRFSTGVMKGVCSRVRRGLGRRRDESGFTLIETILALSILFISVFSLLYTTTSSLSLIAFARQRQAANGIAAKLIEDVRGIAYTTLTQHGLLDSDLAGDSAIVSCSGVYYYLSCSGEKLVHDSTALGSDVVPIRPHRGTFGPPDYPTTYSWSVYVTEAKNVPSVGAFRVTAAVSWANPEVRGAASSVRLQTLVYSPDGCVDDATHPFAAPCQPFFHGVGSIDAGSVATSGTVDGLTFDSFRVDLRQQSAEIQHEQVVHTIGNVRLAGGANSVGAVVTQAGEQAASSASADNDPSTPAGAYATQAIGPFPQASVSETGSGNSLSVTAAGGDTGQSSSAVIADASSPCNGQANGLPCVYTSSTVGNGVNEVLSLAGGIGDATLVSVGGQGGATTAYAQRIVPVAGKDGNVQETVTRSIPTVSIGGLPSGMAPPSGWPGYWVQLSGYAASSSCGAGTDSSAPSLSITGGQISTYGSSTPTTITTTGGAVPTTPFDYTDVSNGIRVQISGTVQFGSSPAPGDPLNGATGQRTDINTSVGPPLVATIDYSVSQNGTPLADLVFDANLGSMTTQCVYQPAPTP